MENFLCAVPFCREISHFPPPPSSTEGPMLKPATPHFSSHNEEIGFIARIVAACAARKFITLALALAVTALAGTYAARHFSISTDLNHLISADLPWRQREIALGQAFPQRSDTFLAVLDAPNPDIANQAARALAAALTPQKQFFESTHCLEASDFFRRDGLLFLPVEGGRSQDGAVDRRPALSRRPRAGSEPARACGRGRPDGARRRRSKGFRRPARNAGRRPGQGQRRGKERFLLGLAVFRRRPTVGDKRRFIQVKPVLDYSALEPGAEAADRLRATARKSG